MAVRIYFIALIVALSTLGITAGTICPQGFWHVSSFCLYTVTSPILNTWKESFEACQAQYGSRIISINSDLFWQALLQAGASQLNVAPGGVWMGLNYTYATNTYQWVDGNELQLDADWTLWAPGQPIVVDRDKCVILEKTYVLKKRFGWSLVDCDNPDTTGVALCVIDQGDYTIKPDASGQACLRVSRSLFTSAFLLLLATKRSR